MTGMCPCQGAGAKAGIPHHTGKDQTRCSMELEPPSSVTSPGQISQHLWSPMFCALSQGNHWSQRELLALCCGRAKRVPRPVPELGEGLENRRSLNRGTQSQRDALGRDPQEKELEALNGDKFHLSRVSGKNFGDFTRLDTGTRAGCGCPVRMTTCPEDTVPARPHRALGGCVWAFSIQSTHAWLGNRTLQAGERPGEAVTHCRL